MKQKAVWKAFLYTVHLDKHVFITVYIILYKINEKQRKKEIDL